MFAIKQAVRSLTYRCPPTVAHKLNHSHSRTSWNLLLKQTPLSISNSCFSCSNNLAATVVKTEGRPTKPLTQEVAAHDEPDALYHMIEVEIKCSDPVVLKSYNKAITLAAECLGLIISHNEVGKKYHVKRWTVLKSRHIHKKHMVTYEVRTYHHKIQLERLTGSTADTFLEYIQRNLPEGVSMRVGRVRMEQLPEHLLTPPSPGN